MSAYGSQRGRTTESVLRRTAPPVVMLRESSSSASACRASCEAVASFADPVFALEGKIWIPDGMPGPVARVRGRYNSSKTRVAPVFAALENARTGDLLEGQPERRVGISGPFVGRVSEWSQGAHFLGPPIVRIQGPGRDWPARVGHPGSGLEVERIERSSEPALVTATRVHLPVK